MVRVYVTYQALTSYESLGVYMVDVSVILPSKNEEETIGICINKIKKVFTDYGLTGEIIVADNSQDKTPTIAKSLGARVVTPDKSGYGYAYRYGLRYASGKYVVMGDADNTYDFLEMPKLLEPLMKGEADLVIGSRFMGKIERGAMPWHHKYVGNPLLTQLLNLFFKARVSDAHSGFKAVTRDALKKLNLNSDGMEFASEILIEAAREGLRIKEVPIVYHRRKAGKSKLSSFSDGWRHVKFMLLHTPTYLFTYPGSFLLLVGIFLMLSALLNFNIGFTPGTHSMIAGSLLAIVGYQAVLFGFFAKIFEHEKLPEFFTLEKGATLGILVFLAGFIWAIKLFLDWVNSGYKKLPPVEQDIMGFTLIVLGLQTFFSSFMLSIIIGSRGKSKTTYTTN